MAAHCRFGRAEQGEFLTERERRTDDLPFLLIIFPGYLKVLAASQNNRRTTFLSVLHVSLFQGFGWWYCFRSAPRPLQRGRAWRTDASGTPDIYAQAKSNTRRTS